MIPISEEKGLERIELTSTGLKKAAVKSTPPAVRTKRLCVDVNWGT
jgi:hypothetical protein